MIHLKDTMKLNVCQELKYLVGGENKNHFCVKFFFLNLSFEVTASFC